jgi:hypothetical protein
MIHDDQTGRAKFRGPFRLPKVGSRSGIRVMQSVSQSQTDAKSRSKGATDAKSRSKDATDAKSRSKDATDAKSRSKTRPTRNLSLLC